MFGLRTASVLAVMSLTVGSAAAFEYSVRSSVPDAELVSACSQALSGYNAPLASNYCRSINGQKLTSEIENKSYELLGDANALMPLASYYLTHKRTYSDSATSPDGRRANAEWKANALTRRDGTWIAPSKGQYLDLNALSQLSVTSELVRADFGVNKQQDSGSYTNYTLGFQTGDTNYKYNRYKFGADLHYRYSVAWNGRKIYDGFIVRHMHIGMGVSCPTDNAKTLEDCNQYEGGKNFGGANFLKTDVRPDRLAIDLLTMESSPFSDMVGFSGSYRIEDALLPKFTNASYKAKTAQRPDLPQYATSFALIEGGRAKFGYKQLAIYTAAQQNAQVASSGMGGETARFIADQQYCAQYAKSSIQEDRAFRNGLGMITGMAGMGEVSSIINTAGSISTIVEGLDGEELSIANSCMQERGHSGIDSALAADSGPTNSAYVPYTAGATTSSASPVAPVQPRAYQGSASTYGTPQSPAITNTSTVASPQAMGSASAYRAEPKTTSSSAGDGVTDAYPIKRLPPVVPPRLLNGNHSGYCRVEFDVTPYGATEEIRFLACTHHYLQRLTKESVGAWEYEPKRVNGVAVTRKNVVSRISFNVQDRKGNTLPLPDEVYVYRQPTTPDTELNSASPSMRPASAVKVANRPTVPPTVQEKTIVFGNNHTDFECSQIRTEPLQVHSPMTGSCVRVDVMVTNNNDFPMEGLNLSNQVPEGMTALNAAAEGFQGAVVTIDSNEQYPLDCDGSNCMVALSASSLSARETGRFMIWFKVSDN